MAQITDTFTVSGTWVAPPDVSSIDSVECWGAGGAGGGKTVVAGGAGGGGGAYAKSTAVSVTAGVAYVITVGTGGVASTGDGGNGGNSAFNVTTVVAEGGKGGGGGAGTSEIGGAGGTTAASTGTTKAAGGIGGATALSSDGGGGGGESGGTGGTGGAGGAGSLATGGAGGTGVNTDGGDGGAGKGVAQGNGNPGIAPGGGGGGAYSTASNETGGTGATGQVKITYTTNSNTNTYLCATGSFITPTSTGSFQVAGLGFQGKAVLFVFDKVIADGSVASTYRSYGMATSSSSRAAVNGGMVDNSAGTGPLSGRAHSNNQVIYSYTDTAGAFVIADFASFDADGFTLSFTTVQATPRICTYMVFGGSDLTAAAIAAVTTPASTGNQANTSLSFKPDCLIGITVGWSGTVNTQQANAEVRFGLGYGVSSSARKASAWGGTSSTPNSRGNCAQRSSLILSANSTALTIRQEADIVSLDATGFTLNWLTVSSGTLNWVLCLKGGKYAVGTISQPTSTGNQVSTGFGLKPTGIILQSFNQASTTSVVANARNSLGFGVAATSRNTFWSGNRDSVTTSITNTNLDRSNILKMMTEATSAAPTTQAVADLVSLNNAGATLNWTTADSTVRELTYFAAGITSLTATSPTRMMMGMGI